MTGPRYVAGDWGTSNLRLYLCDEDGGLVDSAEGPGVAGMPAGFGSLLDTLLEPWETRHGRLPILLCGMVGSNIGWVPAPYVDCPALPEQIAGACVWAGDRRARILPGLRCRNRLGAPDFLRGEETQILGATRLTPALARGHHLLCMPGTHTKWALLHDGRVAEFLTAPTGELFAALRDHSVLLRGSDTALDISASGAFEDGMQRMHDHPRAQLLHLLFECRSRVLAGTPGAADAAFLSGLLVASDVRGALDLLGRGSDTGDVTLVGARHLNQAYAAALGHESVVVHCLDGAEAARAGLAEVYAQLGRQGAPHAA